MRPWIALPCALTLSCGSNVELTTTAEAAPTATSSPVASPETLPSADLAPTPAPVPVDTRERRTSPKDLPLYRTAAVGKLRGKVQKKAPFVVLEHVTAPGCKDWAKVDGDAFACLDGTELTTEPAEMLPKLVAFDPPEPAEWTQYSTGGGYTHDPVGESEALTPAIYGKTWRTWKGAMYSSPESYSAGDKPVGALTWGTKYHFPSAVETDKGTVLIREDGKASPVEDVFLYPIDRFSGRDLTVDPLPDGYVQGWAIEYDDHLPVFAAAEPAADAVPDKMIAYHTSLLIDPVPVDAAGKWFRIKDGIAPGVDGYAKEDKNVPTFRRWDPPTRPEQVADTDLWIDVDLQQQVLTMVQGDKPVYITMVSSGEELVTPVGLFRVYDKFAAADMEGRADATYDPYFVEDVPWTMHFYPRYALHGAYWHWGFGHRASHGCVNLAPKDARYIYEHIGPTMHEGWIEAYASEADPGTNVRIRNGAITVRDRRTPL